MNRPPVETTRRLVLRAGALLAVGALPLSACGSADRTGSTATSGAKGLATVTLALDYLPGAAHNGLAYAMQEGLFAKQGIKVKIIPYGSTAAETLVSAGKADLGLSSEYGTAITALAAGAPMKAIFMLTPRQPFKLAVLASSGITSPAQLGGHTYGGFGAALEAALVDAMIKGAGGHGEIRQVVLSTGSYEALQGKRVDCTFVYPDEAFQFDREGVKLTEFSNADYGVPDDTGNLVIANTAWLTADLALARGFLKAMRQGYQVAIDNPAAANRALLKQFPGVDQALVDYVAKYQAKELFPNPDGPIGTLSVEKWKKYAAWLSANNLLVDAGGKKLHGFDPSPYVTNSYLPAS